MRTFPRGKSLAVAPRESPTVAKADTASKVKSMNPPWLCPAGIPRSWMTRRTKVAPLRKRPASMTRVRVLVAVSSEMVRRNMLVWGFPFSRL